MNTAPTIYIAPALSRIKQVLFCALFKLFSLFYRVKDNIHNIVLRALQSKKERKTTPNRYRKEVKQNAEDVKEDEAGMVLLHQRKRTQSLQYPVPKMYARL